VVAAVVVVLEDEEEAPCELPELEEAFPPEKEAVGGTWALEEPF
jgi:hypothetical protein